MATSGTATFNLDFAEIIEEAYERCGLEARTGYDLKSARRSFNLLMADWANKGLNLWTVESASLSLTASTTSYSLPADTVDVLEMNLRRSGDDTPMRRVSRGVYMGYGTKTNTGRPSQFYVERTLSPKVYVYPAPENSTDTIEYYYARRIEDAGAFTNNPDMPFRFLPAVISGMAYFIGMKKPKKVSPQQLAILKSQYMEDFRFASEEDEDRVPLKLIPSWR